MSEIKESQKLEASKVDAGRSEAREEQAASTDRRILFTLLCLLFLWAGLLVDFYAGGFARFAPAVYLLSYFFGAYFSLSNAISSLFRGEIVIDLLMIVAAFGAALLGEYPEGAVLLFLFSLSGTLEELILGKTRRAIKNLMKLSPEQANVLRDGKEVLVRIEDLALEDLIVVRPGERIAADGLVGSGSSNVDQSAMTGESEPVYKNPGDWVFAGTLNQDGLLRVCVKREAKQTLLANIIELVEKAQSEKAQSETLSRWFGKYYTIGVLLAATLIYLLLDFVYSWGSYEAFYRSMMVLVVASPCAVVISVPAAILSAIAGAARRGILFKGGAHVEMAGRLEAIAFDKTGTLTKGQPAVKHLEPAMGVEPAELLRVAASVEAMSEHPLARAIVGYAKEQGVELSENASLRAVIGKGIVASLGEEPVLVGKPELLREQGVELEESLIEQQIELKLKFGSTVLVAKGGKYLGMISCLDQLRPEAKSALAELKALGLKELLMLTGDQAKVAKKVSEELLIDYRADLLPTDKVTQIDELIKRHQYVGMVGDGINDAPALAKSGLGISLGGSGTAVALESADLVLMGDDLSKLPEAISLGRKARKIIRQNLFIAFGMMSFLLVATFVLKLRLPLAVLGHEGSTVVVILNGLRLLAQRELKP